MWVLIQEENGFTLIMLILLPIYSMGDIDFSHWKLQNLFMRPTAVFREWLHQQQLWAETATETFWSRGDLQLEQSFKQNIVTRKTNALLKINKTEKNAKSNKWDRSIHSDSHIVSACTQPEMAESVNTGYTILHRIFSMRWFSQDHLPFDAVGNKWEWGGKVKHWLGKIIMTWHELR